MNAPQPMPIARHSVAVIGGGQAGLSISWYLKRSGIDHVVFEKRRAGHTWRAERWDTFCLVTPNWQCQLPGFPYQGPDPNGCMLRH
jgi:putative flavoprotein involved in K+ transport